MNDEDLEQLLVELESEGATARERQAAERLRTALQQISQQYKALIALRVERAELLGTLEELQARLGKERDALDAARAKERAELLPLLEGASRFLFYGGWRSDAEAAEMKRRITAALRARGEEQAMASKQRRWPCGCVSCICDDDVKCHGCGAASCGKAQCARQGEPAMTDQAGRHRAQARHQLLVAKNVVAGLEVYHGSMTYPTMVHRLRELAEVLDRLGKDVEAALAAAEAPQAEERPRSMSQDRGWWLYRDEFGQVWRLTPAGVPEMPLIITLESKP